jgi:hypothetical protein
MYYEEGRNFETGQSACVVRFATLDDRLIRRERGDGGIGVGCKIIRQKPL